TQRGGFAVAESQGRTADGRSVAMQVLSKKANASEGFSDVDGKSNLAIRRGRIAGRITAESKGFEDGKSIHMRNMQRIGAEKAALLDERTAEGKSIPAMLKGRKAAQHENWKRGVVKAGKTKRTIRDCVDVAVTGRVST